jgi:hypothetical protein
MAIQIQAACPETHKSALIGLFREHLSSDYDADRFDWLYQKNPAGEAQLWIVSDGNNCDIVGAAAAFPRRFSFRGSEKLGWVLGDFCLTERYRSMGPALQLQRACLRALAAPIDFCYDFPSKSMMAVYKRLGIQHTGVLVRWAKALRIEEKLESLVKSKQIARVVGMMTNDVVASLGWKGAKGACLVLPLEGRCGEEFTSFDRSLRNQSSLRTQRTAEYLNWRYLDSPRKTGEIWVARRDAEMVGYVVLNNDPNDPRIVDLHAVEEPDVIARLIAAAVRRARDSGAKTISLAAGGAHPWNAIFKRTGFRCRESTPMLFVGREGAGFEPAALYADSYIMEGERD